MKHEYTQALNVRQRWCDRVRRDVEADARVMRRSSVAGLTLGLLELGLDLNDVVSEPIDPAEELERTAQPRNRATAQHRPSMCACLRLASRNRPSPS